jgi:UDP-galactose transporter B1
MFGIMLIIASLLFDGLVSSQTDKEHQSSGRDYAYSLMFSNNFVQLLANTAVFSFTWLRNGDDTLSRIFSNGPLLRDVLMISASGALGQIFIYFAISIFNTYLLAIITTSRKLFSVVISNMAFNLKR